jgi:excisionase family DNA binding protein
MSQPKVKWHTAETAAQHATVSEWTIRQAVKDGELPAYPVGKTGRGYRLIESEVDDWMRSRSYEPGRAS